jgi:hypothetical protein
MSEIELFTKNSNAKRFVRPKDCVMVIRFKDNRIDMNSAFVMHFFEEKEQTACGIILGIRNTGGVISVLAYTDEEGLTFVKYNTNTPRATNKLFCQRLLSFSPKKDCEVAFLTLKSADRVPINGSMAWELSVLYQ